MTTRLFLSAAGLLLVACQNTGLESQWGARGAVTVLDEYDLDVDGVEAETDYQAVRGGIYARYEDRDGVPVASADFQLGAAEFGSLETTELVLGGRYFLHPTDSMRPFVGLSAVWTDYENLDGLDSGSQVTLGPALGVEIPVTDKFWFDVMVDYQFAVMAAEDDGSPAVEREGAGLSVFVGLGVDF